MSVPPAAFNARTCFSGSLADEQVFCPSHKAHLTARKDLQPSSPWGEVKRWPSHPYSDYFDKPVSCPLPEAAAQDTPSPWLRGCPQPPHCAWLLPPLTHCQGLEKPLTVFDEHHTHFQAMNPRCDKKYKTREIKLHRLLFQLRVMTPAASAGWHTT